MGIEKLYMIIKDDIQISLWDLGGQDEFHSLHDLVIQNTNIQGIASSFFLLCKLIRNKKECKNQLDEYCAKIMNELTYWIRFIASNMRLSMEFTPRIIIIFTFCD
jgi:GTPase SAR1 family protein